MVVGVVGVMCFFILAVCVSTPAYTTASTTLVLKTGLRDCYALARAVYNPDGKIMVMVRMYSTNGDGSNVQYRGGTLLHTT